MTHHSTGLGEQRHNRIEIRAEKLPRFHYPNFKKILEDDKDKTQLGFIFLEIGTDYYHREPHGHIADIIVAPEARGRGIGKMLMQKAEEWTKDCGYSLLTLNVFDDNKKARKLYQSLGFTPDLTKYGKIL